jgi:N-acetyl-anhydromuramyl-L-alanine amidase AmpD
MKAPTLVDYNLEFGDLTDRDVTDMIVIHHTGNPEDDDLSAEEIHESHLAQGWAGIGYHYVIRKDGTIELGRPMDSIGAHAYGENSHTIGIHVCGNFEIAYPTESQIESLSYLIGWLCEQYGLEYSRDVIVGHRDLMPTACPGDNLYVKINDVVGKAAWYHAHYDDDGVYHV